MQCVEWDRARASCQKGDAIMFGMSGGEVIEVLALILIVMVVVDTIWGGP